MAHEFTDYITNRLRSLINERNRVEHISVAEQYELMLLEKLDGYYDDLADFQNLQIALTSVLQLVNKNAEQASRL